MVQSGRLFVRIFDRLVRSGFAGAKLSSRDDRMPEGDAPKNSPRLSLWTVIQLHS